MDKIKKVGFNRILKDIDGKNS
ncbi:hypothetical protein [Borreliella garinii]